MISARSFDARELARLVYAVERDRRQRERRVHEVPVERERRFGERRLAERRTVLAARRALL